MSTTTTTTTKLLDRASRNWERLVLATATFQTVSGGARPLTGLAAAVPPSLAKTTNIESILHAADYIEVEDPNVSRILYEQAYNVAHNLDPRSDGRGVLQFKTNLKSLIDKKFSKKDGARIDREGDVNHLWKFYLSYKRRYRVDDTHKEQERWREPAVTFSSGEFERRVLQMRRAYTTLRALIDVLEMLVEGSYMDGVGRSIMEEVRKTKKSNSILMQELTSYNIVPLDAPSTSNAIGFLPEVKAAISAVSYKSNFPILPDHFKVSDLRKPDIFDLLEYVFGFQKDNVRNQRENVVLTIANAQSCLGFPVEADPKIDEKAIADVFHKVLDNYIKWCKYLGIHAAWNSSEAVDKTRMLICVSLYFLIWGEAANVRFLSECICYIFHHMAKELGTVLNQPEAQPARSCKSGNGHVSFLQEIICPIYDAIAAEASYKEGKAPHTAWRNYDDFNEYFWSRSCFELSWPPQKDSSFLFKPRKRKRTSKSNFVEHRTFLHLYRSFHRLWIFLILMFQNMSKAYATTFSPFWNEIIKSLREEDYISNREMYLLFIPSNTGSLQLVQWPLFLLSSKISTALDLALGCEGNQVALWNEISPDKYMVYAVQECYCSAEIILWSLVLDDGRLWVERLFREIDNSISQESLLVTVTVNKLQLVLSRFKALTGLIVNNETPHLKGVSDALHDLYDVVNHDLLISNLREEFATWPLLVRERNEGRLFSKIEWPRDPDIIEQIKRLHQLITVMESAANIPENLEAQRRLQFFTNSLFMDMPLAKPVSETIPFSVFTPYYEETVLYKSSDLWKENEDGISILFYLQTIYRDEWKNFLERTGCTGLEEKELKQHLFDSLELRLWASYRGQTLARTVRGMMYYKRALVLQSYLEKRAFAGIEDGYSGGDYLNPQGCYSCSESQAQADLKFTYVVSCQLYSTQKQDQSQEAADIALLMQRNEALRVAFIHEEKTIGKDGNILKEFYSKLVKADAHGKEQEIYSIKLPGNFKLGEGKPENQNHSIIFTRGDAIQTIDMNQDNYLEEAMKMRNLLEEFRGNHGLRPPTILGIREHVFTGSVSSLAWFMSNQETSFVTLGQRVLAYPLKVRMHYGHPDVFDRIFHISRGGISKASRGINISEDIYAGLNSTLRQGNITHHEYIQVGKGRDVGLNQIALFEGKVSGGNGEQALSRDIYRLGQLLDFFRMLSFFYTSVGYYVCTMMTLLTVYIFLYGRVYLALSGIGSDISDRARLSGNTALNTALNAQFLVQIGIFTAVPMVMGFFLELGLWKAVFSFIGMQLQLCSVFFTFSLGTRTHYFGRTILHGGAKYKATGRGFVVEHIKFAENYRFYSRSHFVKAFEITLLLIVYISYTRGGSSSFFLLTMSSWFLVISWLFSPYIFNPSAFEWQKTVEDFDDWIGWLLYRDGVGVEGKDSWESWWEEEQMHIQTLRGRILETLLSLRFFMFQYGIVYQLNLTGDDTSLAVYGYSWFVLFSLVVAFKIFTFSSLKKSANFKITMRFIQGIASVALISALALVVALTTLSITDLFASALAFVATGWGILCLAITWKRLVKTLRLWDSVCEIARWYDAGMGMLIFAPVAFLSWFPFVSTFQSRLLFNQAFSRGLEFSMILVGNKANV